MATSAGWTVTFATDDTDATAGQAARLSGKVVVPLADSPFVRLAVLRDPQGATFTVSKFVAENKPPARLPPSW
jgi:uncharacterized protein